MHLQTVIKWNEDQMEISYEAPFASGVSDIDKSDGKNTSDASGNNGKTIKIIIIISAAAVLIATALIAGKKFLKKKH